MIKDGITTKRMMFLTRASRQLRGCRLRRRRLRRRHLRRRRRRHSSTVLISPHYIFSTDN